MLLARCYLNPPKLVNPLKTLHNFLRGWSRSKIFSEIGSFLAFFGMRTLFLPEDALKGAALTFVGFVTG